LGGLIGIFCNAFRARRIDREALTASFAESGETIRVLRNGKPIADIVPVMADLPSWKRRKAQPLVIGGESVSRLILEERGSGA
jgi:hypothetical protein